MDKILIINIVLVLVAIAGLVILWIKGKKTLVKTIISKLVDYAEQYFTKEENQAKFDYVLKAILLFTNRYWILKLFITEKNLRKWINEAVELMQKYLGTTSERENAVKSMAVRFAAEKVQELSDNIVKSDYDGNVNLIDNSKVIDIRNDILGKIDNEAGTIYAKLKTGFTKATTTAELGFIKWF